ncbi:MAG: DUF4360 domain-containing protein [Polyangiales bacterium]
MPRMSSIRFDRQARRRMLVGLATAATLAACAAEDGAPDHALDPPEAPAEQPLALQAPGGVRVTEITATGAGCPSGSWRSTVSDDGSAVTIAFRRFLGELSGRAERATRNCVVSIDVRGQEGTQYAPATVHLAGKSDSFVSYGAELRWSGTAATRKVSADAGGTFERSFFTNDFWSSCGSEGRLHVDTQIGAERTGRNAFELIEETVSFRSRRCPDAPAQPERPTEPAQSDAASVVSLSRATTSGSGCPDDATRAVITPDGKALSISFERLDGAMSRSCSIFLEVQAPAGQSYALAGFTAHGRADLTAGVTGRLLINTAYTGLGVDLAKEKVGELVGPVRGDVALAQEFTDAELNFSPCDGSKPPLRLNVRPTLADGGQGAFAVTSIDSLRFALRSCPQG